MLIVDQVKKADSHLQWLAIGVLMGMAVLLTGLWYVQILSSRQYQDSLNVQAFRVVRVPAIRGKILDRNGVVLAENQPRFTVNLYLEDLRGLFKFEYTNHVKTAWMEETGRKSPKWKERLELEEIARYRAVSNIVWQLSSMVTGQPQVLIPKKFADFYNEKRWLPLPILTNLNSQQVAVFMEKAVAFPGVDLEVQAMRHYPQTNNATHMLGYVQKEDPSEDEDLGPMYSLPEYAGKTGIERGFNADLLGKPGIKAVLVNNMGYRQREETRVKSEPGQNLILTIDGRVQKAAAQALQSSGRETRGAAVVLDVTNGDILALASSPSFDPHMFLGPISREDWDVVDDPRLHPQINRASVGAYPPGSIFKIVIGLAGLEAGTLEPDEEIYCPGYYSAGGNSHVNDLAPPGNYNFKNAFKHSSNCYFIEHGLKAGTQKVVEMGRRFHLGERISALPRGQESAGYFPKVGDALKKDGTPWRDGDTVNLSIGQGEIAVTPLQMAVMTAAVANGGKVFRPRLAARLVPQDTTLTDGMDFPYAQIENDLHVNARHLQLVREAMLADVEEKGGTGVKAFISGYRVSGKTGTAQVEIPHAPTDHITWFVSFAPYEAPKYAVVVMVESGTSGGGDCAPKAREIYLALRKIDQEKSPRTVASR